MNHLIEDLVELLTRAEESGDLDLAERCLVMLFALAFWRSCGGFPMPGGVS